MASIQNEAVQWTFWGIFKMIWFPFWLSYLDASVVRPGAYLSPVPPRVEVCEAAAGVGPHALVADQAGLHARLERRGCNMIIVQRKLLRIGKLGLQMKARSPNEMRVDLGVKFWCRLLFKCCFDDRTLSITERGPANRAFQHISYIWIGPSMLDQKRYPKTLFETQLDSEKR